MIPTVKKQGDLFSTNRDFAPNRISFGGDIDRGKRKLSRPFKSHAAMHLVLKSENASGVLSMRAADKQIAIERIIDKQAARFVVKIHADQNVGNHLHLIVSCGRRENFQRFLKAVTGLIAMLFLKGKRGKFWTQPAFTRIITGARDYRAMFNYLAKNLIEAYFGSSARSQFEVGEADARKEIRRTKRPKCASPKSSPRHR